jgi:16S rRNA G966 N2-methylase RsmD
MLKELDGRRLLGPGSIVVTESSRDDDLPLAEGGIGIIKTKIYGETKITVYEHGERR